QSLAPEFASQIRKANDELKAKIEKSKNNPDVIIKSISADLKGEDIFKALVAPYKGKQVLVDFWATWCGPCRAAMKTIQPVKEELMGKVAFIYITGPSSPKGTWNNMIQDIHGEHYYVTEEQWNSLLNQFESQGTPTYVIVDKEGNVQNKYIGYPGNDTMKAELSK
ncbi:MAG: TlpA family protein disulfide reductase, partial [Bacteroidaceae bacterium]|nr:TlpA family protein disulfide reductase [Bacteroidaceae bacterium]